VVYLALIIPCYNEELRVEKTFLEYFNYFKKTAKFANKEIAIVLVDDGSKDKTKEVIKKLESFSDNQISVKSFSYENNRGKGAAIKEGAKIVDAQYYGFSDADLSFQPALIEKAMFVLEGGNDDLLLGQRISDENRSFYSKFRAFFSSALRRVVNYFLSIPNIDTQCGFKFFKRHFVKHIFPEIKENRFSFDVELVILAQEHNYQANLFPINFRHDEDSRVTMKDGVRYILDTIGISERLRTVKEKSLFFQLLILSVIISFLIYGWVIWKGYLFSDDFTWLWHGQKIGNDLQNILTFKMSTFYSPVLNAFYSFMYGVFGYASQPLFLLGIIVHVLVSFLSGVLAWQLSKSRFISIVSSCLVALGGIAYEPLVWIGANMHSFVTLFIVLSLVSFYQYFKNSQIVYLLISFLCFVLALGTKESAVVTPFLLLVTFVYYKIKNKRKFEVALIFYWVGVFLLLGFYLYQQYLWQKNSVWIESGIYSIDLMALFRIPLIFFNNFIPISPISGFLNNWMAVCLWLFAVGVFSFILFRFKNLMLIWYSFLWMGISIGPFIFFKTALWWDTLASRYNYLPRIGAVFLIAVILQYLIVNNKSRYIINGLVYCVMISIFAQLFFMVQVIRSEYEYVYNTGRSLSDIMELTKKIQPERVFVRWDHPFTENNAHIVGAASVVAGIGESSMVFLPKDAPETLNENEILIYWNPELRKYDIKQNTK